MKNIIITFLCVVSVNIFVGATSFNGSVHLNNKQYAELNIYGSGHLTGVKVDNSTIISGSAHLIDFTCPQLDVQGSVQGKKLIVNYADIKGSFQCVEGTFDELIVHGTCTLDTVKVKNNLCVYGGIHASDLECSFIEVTSIKIELKNSRVNSILVKKNDNNYCGFFNLWGLLNWWSSASQATVVYLDGGSVNSITFQGLPGTVVLTHDAQIGTIINGTSEIR